MSGGKFLCFPLPKKSLSVNYKLQCIMCIFFVFRQSLMLTVKFLKPICVP